MADVALPKLGWRRLILGCDQGGADFLRTRIPVALGHFVSSGQLETRSKGMICICRHDHATCCHTPCIPCSSVRVATSFSSFFHLTTRMATKMKETSAPVLCAVRCTLYAVRGRTTLYAVRCTLYAVELLYAVPVQQLPHPGCLLTSSRPSLAFTNGLWWSSVMVLALLIPEAVFHGSCS